MSGVTRAPECRLAHERPEYDTHYLCGGTTVVRIEGCAPITTQRCDCPCHGESFKVAGV